MVYAEDNPVAARELVKEILDTINMLSEQPGMGRPGTDRSTRILAVIPAKAGIQLKQLIIGYFCHSVFFYRVIAIAMARLKKYAITEIPVD